MADAILAAERFYVYIHIRPSTGTPFYIGKGNGSRVYTHAGRSSHWQRIVKKEGGRRIQFITENVDEELAFLIEVEAIDQYRRLGIKIINKTDGGEGCCGYKMTPEQSARISEAKRGNTFNLGRTHSEETRRKMSEFQSQRPKRTLSDEHKNNIASSMIGNKRRLGGQVSAETRAKLSLAAKGHHRGIGRVFSDEHKRKISEIQKNRSQEEKNEISEKLSRAINNRSQEKKDAINKKLSLSIKAVWEERKKKARHQTTEAA